MFDQFEIENVNSTFVEVRDPQLPVEHLLFNSSSPCPTSINLNLSLPNRYLLSNLQYVEVSIHRFGYSHRSVVKLFTVPYIPRFFHAIVDVDSWTMGCYLQDFRSHAKIGNCEHSNQLSGLVRYISQSPPRIDTAAWLAHVRYVNIREWLIANFSSFLCPSIPKRGQRNQHQIWRFDLKASEPC